MNWQTVPRANFVFLHAARLQAHDLPVAGTLPPQLTGVYLRNGPNPRPGSDPFHFVAGDGMVHGVRLLRVVRLVPRPRMMAVVAVASSLLVVQTFVSVTNDSFLPWHRIR